MTTLPPELPQTQVPQTQLPYPRSPEGVPAAFTRANPSYRRQTWVALAALLVFLVVYLAFSGWFVWKAYSFFHAALAGGNNSLTYFLLGTLSGFFGVFLLKALFFIKKADLEGLTEVSQADHPRLFEFIYRLADEAGAPRPYKIYLSSRVNASVFYNVSFLGLFIPTRKNLEIGLPLVNVLNLSEFKGVIAHEFGHFAQRSMAVGTWVYVGQQVAQHIVGHRDVLDRFISGLSRFDLRIAWVGWIMSLVVWAIRSLIDTLFRGVVLAERALSREMEFQADKVSVATSGSDALISALYKTRAADTGWDQTLSIANAQLQEKKVFQNLYRVHSAVIKRLSTVLDDPHFVTPPAAGAEADPAQHRLFKPEQVQVLKMWSTHPSSADREARAKAQYLSAEFNTESAWCLFSDPQGTQARATAALLPDLDSSVALMTPEEEEAALQAHLNPESYQGYYHGLYLGREIARSRENVDSLYDEVSPQPLSLQELYPEWLKDAIKGRDDLEAEIANLRTLQSGVGQSADRQGYYHRGRYIKRRESTEVIAELKKELRAIREKIDAVDRLNRSNALAQAKQLGNGWPEYWRSLLALAHYAEHQRAKLGSARQELAQVISLRTAKGRVNKGDLNEIVDAAQQVYVAMNNVMSVHRNQLSPDQETLARLRDKGGLKGLGDWSLPHPFDENIGEWLDVIDSWFGAVMNALNDLVQAGLNQLLHTEGRIRDLYAAGSFPTEQAAPPPVAVPAEYPRSVPTDDEPPQRNLDWWSRFITADGAVATTARAGVAAALVFGVVSFSSSLSYAKLHVVNGLDRDVTVKIDNKDYQLHAFTDTTIQVAPERSLNIETRTDKGELIESFKGKVNTLDSQQIYNIANATGFWTWTAVYGSGSEVPPERVGAERWFQVNVDDVLVDPPESISTSGDGDTRTVLATPEEHTPLEQLILATDEEQLTKMIAAHQKWDRQDSKYRKQWATALQDLKAAAGKAESK